MTLTIAEWRLLHIVYCPHWRCQQDTMPDLHTGRCFFCETKLQEPQQPRGSREG